MTTATSFKRRIDFSARDRHPQPLSGTGRKPPKPRERQTGTRSAPTQEKHHRSGMRGVLANRLRTAETTLSYYVGRNAERTAAILWHEHEKAAEPERKAQPKKPRSKRGKTST